jgi:hypothetical protein
LSISGYKPTKLTYKEKRAVEFGGFESRRLAERHVAKIAVTFEGTKDRLHQAYQAAKRADRLSGALYDRWMAEALSLSKGQPVERAVAMLLRTAVMLEIAAERKGWPDRIAGLPDLVPLAEDEPAA